MKIVMSSGHGKKIRGAAGPWGWGLDEVNSARKVVEQTAIELRNLGVEVATLHDDQSTSQSANLDWIVQHHNALSRDIDVSVHLNAYQVTTTKMMGTEVLYKTQETLAQAICDKICAVTPLPNRGAKYNGGLAFLNGTSKPAVLVEVLFCDAKLDCDVFRNQFDDLCLALAEGLSGKQAMPDPKPETPKPEDPKPAGVLFQARGKCSHFGGPNDTGVAPDEGLAFISNVDQAPQLFLPFQPPATTGLARRLNPVVHYIACRWDYAQTSKEMLRSGKVALVSAKGRSFKTFPADWGPNEKTGRVADLSPGLMEDLGIKTDDEVEVIFPHAEPDA